MRQHLFLEDIEDAGLSRLEPLNNLEEETATTASVDFSYTINSIETSLALFDSDIEKVTKLEKTGCISCDKTVRIVNAQGLSEIRGAELLLRFRWHDIKFTTIYLYTDASTQDDTTGLISPNTLTPRHSAGSVIVWEEHSSHLHGFEPH